ncbi:RNA polymerase recycling motor ATPase HelR [Microbacterium pygmaeum]|uniref:RNA polymerase recycling motor ATPase HelR n=1 Tax=Microbacterium pygmaeum TaxID=370764 RepID=UPI000B86C372|nr:RNA polymerase recycling motor ATPase HelR [Microbacterium pygmaeum]
MTDPLHVFDLDPQVAAKADPALIAADEAHFALLSATLDQTVAEVIRRRDEALAQPGGTGQEAMDRDLEVRRLSTRLSTLRRFGLDLCLGKMVFADDREPVYIGRIGLTDASNSSILRDWRSPAAEPFFGATHANPMGLLSRRRYRWHGGRIHDYWDEVFTAEGLAGTAALDDQSAFLASLGSTRSERMRDVLSTIQADQDAIIRAPSPGTLVVDGGPGTGKTVVALHRAAYLLYSDPRVDRRRGGVLFVGPHEPYLAYVSDILPGLSEDGVELCTLRDLVPEGAAAVAEADTEVVRLKSSARMIAAIEPAVGLYEEPPTVRLRVETPWLDLEIGPEEWTEAFQAAESGVPHNEARDDVLEALLDILLDSATDQTAGGVPLAALRRSLLADDGLMRTFNRAWPLLEADYVVGTLWSVPAYLRRCAPWLGPDEVRVLQRAEGSAWTDADLPLLDAARLRLGDAEATVRRRRREARQAAERAEMAEVIEHLIAADDSEMQVMSMLRRDDFQYTLIDGAGEPDVRAPRFAGPFAHIVVDEAQEMTDAQWQMLLLRCPTRSFTVVGDRAQARHGFTRTWEERLTSAGLDRITRAPLTVNYRTPEEIMAEAEPVIRAAIPDANVPTSIRGSGLPVRRGAIDELGAVLGEWESRHPDAIACVIGSRSFVARPRVRSLTPESAKGLEFDLVVLVDPDAFGDGIEGAVDRYVSMTRATQQLVILTSP